MPSEQQSDEIIEILRSTIREYRALLNSAAALIVKEQDRQENQKWLELAEKYGVCNVRRANNGRQGN